MRCHGKWLLGLLLDPCPASAVPPSDMVTSIGKQKYHHLFALDLSFPGLNTGADEKQNVALVHEVAK